MSTAAESRTARRTRPAPAAPTQRGPIENVATWVDARTGGAGFSKYLMRKVFPDHWSFMLGEIALWSFVVLLVSGVFIILTASLSLDAIRSLDWRAALFVAALLVVIRPVAIMLATIGSGATFQERLLSAWIAR